MAVSVVDANPTRPNEKIPPLHRDMPPLPKLKGQQMIEKIPKQNTWGQCLDKINELVDAVNDITDWIKRTDETIVKYGIKPIENTTISKMEKDHRPNMVMDDPFGPHPNIYEQGRPVDPYAEQRKWIGKLCRFSDDRCVSTYISLLKQIDDDDTPFADDKGVFWQHCEPVKPDDDIIYKGDKDA